MDISATELQQRYANAETVTILDVREELEFHTFNIGGDNIPLGNLLRSVDDLDYNKQLEIIVVCQHGLRSETARRVLEQHGYMNVKNLNGGLLGWRKLDR
jgi:rhodanese-related sulfurtransferase